MTSAPSEAEMGVLDDAREVLCRRMREHKLCGTRSTDCNGRTVVCGFCDNTVRQQLRAIAARLRQRGEG